MEIGLYGFPLYFRKYILEIGERNTSKIGQISVRSNGMASEAGGKRKGKRERKKKEREGK